MPVIIKNDLPKTTLTTSDFDYQLPEELIAQTPLAVRDSSKLMVVKRFSSPLESEDKIFRDIIDYLEPSDTLVVNDTRVIPARMLGLRVYRASDGTDLKAEGAAQSVELLLLRAHGTLRWETLAGPGKHAKTGDILEFGFDAAGKPLIVARVAEVRTDGNRIVDLTYDAARAENIYDALHQVGLMPLPPYITEKLDDGERYQTVYSRVEGSAAAPTAGLHFTPELLERINEKGIAVVPVLLHVGLGTFRPVKEEELAQHVMHTEFISVSRESADIINSRRKAGGRTIAVGTTSCRTLESVADENGNITPFDGDTGIFIYPGYKFKAIDALITNFHLPKSTLLMLVSAFAGRETMLNAYNDAVAKKYRFFSFGDAMFIV